VKTLIVRFLKDEEGLTMVEYAIAGALVAATAVAVFTNLGAAIVTRITALVAAVNALVGQLLERATRQATAPR
jgi:pilus assembly protein Flp/PilA